MVEWHGCRGNLKTISMIWNNCIVYHSKVEQYDRYKLVEAP